MLNEQALRNKLKDLRIKHGFTEAEVAARLGKSSNSYVNRIENGPTKLNIEALDELCSLYKISPLELLQSSGSPVTVKAQEKGFFEKSVFRGSSNLEEDTRAQIKDLLPTLRKIGDIQEILGKNPVRLEDISAGLTEINMKSPFAAETKAREAASRLRQFFKIDANSSVDVVSFCWNHLNIPISGIDLGENCWGMHSSDKHGNPLILYSNSHKFLQRNIFTIAHEIGHYLFAHDHMSVDCETNENTIVEKVADTFAQEFLVPSAALRQTYDDLGLSLVKEIKPHHIVSLCDYFKVSFFMMAVCLRSIKKISFDKYTELKDFCVNRLAGESEALGYHPENYFSSTKPLKSLLRELVIVALRKEQIGFFEASKLLDEPVSDLKAAM